MGNSRLQEISRIFLFKTRENFTFFLHKNLAAQVAFKAGKTWNERGNVDVRKIFRV